MERIIEFTTKSQAEELSNVKKDAIYIWRTLRTLSSNDLKLFELQSNRPNQDQTYDKILDEIFGKMIPNNSHAIVPENPKNKPVDQSSNGASQSNAKQLESPQNSSPHKNGKRSAEKDLEGNQQKQVKTN